MLLIDASDSCRRFGFGRPRNDARLSKASTTAVARCQDPSGINTVPRHVFGDIATASSLGNNTEAPLRNAVRQKLREASWNLAPTAVVDAAVDASFELLARKGLDKIDATALKKRKNELRSEVSRRVAAAADTPLGDDIEAKLGGAVVDALFDQVTSSTELLSTPRERLIVLEGKVSDVKRELGLIRLTWHRVRKHARAILLAGATVAGLLWARAAGVGLRWIH